MEPVDLGHGTTRMWTADGEGTPCTLWPVDGRVIPIATRKLLMLSLALQHGADEAAYRLGVGPGTVKNNLTALYRRLGVFGRDEAALALGWLRIPPALLDTPDARADHLGGRLVSGQEEGAGAPSSNCPTCIGLGCGECCNTGRGPA